MGTPPVGEIFRFSSRCGILHRYRALLLGLMGYVASMGCWYLALHRLALSKAYALLSLSYILVWGRHSAARLGRNLLLARAGGRRIYYSGCADHFSADASSAEWIRAVVRPKVWRAYGKAQGADLAVAYRMEGAGSTVDADNLPGVRATLFDDGAFTRPDTPEHGKLTLWFFVFHFIMFGMLKTAFASVRQLSCGRMCSSEQPTSPSSLTIRAISSSQWLMLNHSG
jgi:hypothetical protein